MRLGSFLALCVAAVPALAAITGTVMTIDGAPIAGARVSIRAYESNEARNARLLSANPEAVPIASTQTDAKGSFTLDSPKEPVVDLLVSASGYNPHARRVERDEEAGAIAMQAAEMRGGRIVNGAGKPVANALVSVMYGTFEYLARTDAEGRYQAPDLKRARTLTVVHPDFAPDEKTFTFPNGGSASDLNRTLTPGVALSGKVVAADGQTGVADAAILLDGWPVATSGDDGTFTIAHAPSRWTMLTARKESLLAQRPFSKEALQTLRLARPATVSGRMIDAKTKLPVAGAVVRAGGRRMMMAGSEWGPAAVTDAKGSYTLALPAGTYFLTALHPGYTPPRTDVALTAGQQVTKDFNPSPLARITGMVVDEGKKPVAAAIIATDDANAPGMGGGMRFMRMDEQSVSGPDGRYSIRAETETALIVRATRRGMPGTKSDTLELAPGERKTGVVLTIPSGIAVTGRATDAQGEPLSGVAVTATESERGGMMMRSVFLGGPERDDGAVRTATDGTFTMRVKEGTYDFTFRREGFASKTVRGQNVTPMAATMVEARLEPAVEISGRVVRAGTGIENARVSAFGMNDQSMATTGPDGSFTLTGLTPGSQRVMVRKEDDFIQEMRAIEAPAGDVLIEVKAGGRVTGRVTEKGSGKPVTVFQAGISTSGAGGGMVRMSPPLLRDFNADDGSFTLDNVPPGAVVLVVNAPGYAAGRMNLTVEEGKTLSDADVQLDTGVKLVGRVTGPSGQGLGDVTVRLMPSATGGFSMGGMDRSTTTDSSGEYTFEALDAGEETVAFSHAKFADMRKAVTLKGRETRLDVSLSGGQKVTGTVVTEGGAPVADAEVRAFSSGAGEVVRTNASGTFEMTNLTPGRYRFNASKAGYADGVADDVDISAGAPVRITLQTGGTVYGTITGLSERELSQATVEARSGRESSRGTVDASGNYRIEGAPIGTVSVSVGVMSGNGYRSKESQPVQVAAGSSQQVDITFRGDVVIRGRVTRNGEPLGSAGITFFPARSSESRSMTNAATDAQGQYSVSGLEDGEYTVSVIDANRFSPYSTTYMVRGSATFDIDYRTSAVRGRVIDVASNEPIANVNVQLRQTGASTSPNPFMNTRAAVTDASGAFVLDSIPPGNFTVTAAKDGFGTQVQDVTVGTSAIDNLELRLASNAGSTLKVVDGRDGRALRAFITVFDTQGRIAFENRAFFGGGGTDTGELKVSVAPGSYTAFVSAVGYGGRNISFQSPTAIPVSLTPGGTIVLHSRHSERRRLRILDANGLAYWRSTVAPPYRDLNPAPGATTWPNVATGTYTIQLMGDNDVVVDSKQVVVQEGQTTRVEM